MKNLLLTLAIGLTSVSGFAYSNYSDDYFTLKSIEVKEVTDTEENTVSKSDLKSDYYIFSELSTTQTATNIGEVIKVTNELIALGERIYSIIEKGKPVVSLNSAPISVLPNENGQVVNAFRLSKWKNPKVKKFIVEAKNLLGMTPISFEFTVLFSHGGKYNNKGAYISGAQIIPTKAEVAWGYSLDAKFSVQQITNQGSTEDPVAAAVLSMNYTISTVLKSATENALFFINGNGVATSL